MMACVLRTETMPLSPIEGEPLALEFEAATVMNSGSFRASGWGPSGGKDCRRRQSYDINNAKNAPRPRKRSGPRGPLPGTTDTTGYCRSFRTSEGSCCACESIDTPDCIRIWSVLNVDVAWAQLTSTRPL